MAVVDEVPVIEEGQIGLILQSLRTANGSYYLRSPLFVDLSVPPVISAPDSVTLKHKYTRLGLYQNAETLTLLIESITAVDANGSNVAVTTNISTLGDPILEGVYEVIATAVDGRGNQSSVTFELIVEREERIVKQGDPIATRIFFGLVNF